MFPAKAKTKYFPRNLAVASSRNEDVYEFLVVWDHQIESLPEILRVFSKHKAKVTLAHSQLDEDTDTVVGTFFYNLAKADESAENIGKEIKTLRFVRTVEVASTANSLFDKFLFPVTIWGQERVVMMRMEPLLNIERRLVQELGSAGSAIMFREGEGYATATVDQYRKVLGSVTIESLLENLRDGLRATGWGIFEFEATKDGYVVTVESAPALPQATEPSRFLCGIIAGILEALLSANMSVVESNIDQKSGRVVVKLLKSG